MRGLPDRDHGHIADIIWLEIKRQPAGWRERAAQQLRYTDAESLMRYVSDQARNLTRNQGPRNKTSEPAEQSDFLYQFLSSKLHGLGYNAYLSAIQNTQADVSPQSPKPEEKRQRRIQERIASRTPDEVYLSAMSGLERHFALTDHEKAYFQNKRSMLKLRLRREDIVEVRDAKYYFGTIERIIELREQDRGGGKTRWPTFDEMAEGMLLTPTQVLAYLRSHLPARFFEAMITRRDRKGRIRGDDA